MHFKNVLLVTIATILGLQAADYCFPSPMPPANRPPSGVDQYVTLMFNENYHTGLDGNYYPCHEKLCWCVPSCVGGKDAHKTHGFPSFIPEGDEFQIREGDIGMAWAIQLGVPVTFNMTTGLYVPVKSPASTGSITGYTNKESPLGYMIPSEGDSSEEWGSYHRRAVSWGSEQEFYDGDELIYPACYTIVTNMAIEKGHEIGNHTLDNLAPDSPLPGGTSQFADRGFGRWNGEGFDHSHNDTMPWGTVIDEATFFNQDSGLTANKSGWKINAGSYIHRSAWNGVIDLSEEWLFKGSNMTKEQLNGFCAPRQEIGSGLFYALADRGYEYDCSIEEGYEQHRDGKNFLWPYTIDNGSQTNWTRCNKGERSLLDSMPSERGLWEIPFQPLIVPEHIRESVWVNRAEILLAKGVDEDEVYEEKLKWLFNGRIKATDYETFIEWGMVDSNWTEIMENTIQLRLDGNKSPLVYHAHSQYYTPNYDYNYLLQEKQKSSIGLSVVKGWNNWESRILSMEEWIAWAQGKGIKFVTGHQLIEEVKKLSKYAQVPGYEIDMPYGFSFTKNPKLDPQTVTSVEKIEEEADVHIVVGPPHGNERPYPSYYTLVEDEDIAFVSLKYKISNGAALKLVFHFDSNPSREVLLHNTGTSDWVSSGFIPVSAFDFNPLEDKENIDYERPIDFSKVLSFSIEPVAPLYKNDGSGKLRDEPYSIRFSVKDIKLFRGKPNSLIENIHTAKGTISIRGTSHKSLNLHTKRSGSYTIQLYTLRGQRVYQIEKQCQSNSVNSIAVDAISKGIYIVKVVDSEGVLQLSQKVSLR